MQAERRLAVLRRQEDVDAGGADDDGAASVGFDDQENADDRRLLGGGEALDFDDSTGDIAWGKMLERVKAEAAPRPSQGRGFAARATSATGATAEATRGGGRPKAVPNSTHHRRWFSPRLIFFLLPICVLAAFYAVVYSVSTTAVGNVLVAQKFFVVAATRSGLVSGLVNQHTIGCSSGRYLPPHM